MIRFSFHLLSVLAFSISLWLLLGFARTGGIHKLLLYDPLGPMREQRALAAKVGATSKNASVLVYMADSTCTCVQVGNPADEAVPPLGRLLQKGLTGPGRLLPHGWELSAFCSSGNNAYMFENLARGIAAFSVPPKAALIVVNLRSLNRLGTNGFYNQFGAASTLLPAPREISARTRSGLLDRLDDAVRFSLPASLLRSQAAWTCEFLSALITPHALPVKTKDTLHGHYQMVYGDGFALNGREMGALIGAGDILEGLNCRVLYYITPMDRKMLAEQMGPAVVKQSDAAAAQVVLSLRQVGYPVLDLHAMLDTGFIELPSEHLSASGRLAVARRLAPWVYAQLFPDRIRKDTR